MQTVVTADEPVSDDALAAPGPHRRTHHAPRAKRVIYLFMNGGPSHVDTWDHKPELVKRANEELSNLVDAGALSPLLTERLAFEDAASGIARIAAGETTGRIAVNMP